MILILSILCLLIAGSLNAIMDVLDNAVKFESSIFKELNKSFWLKSASWKRKYKQYGNTGTLIVKCKDSNGKPVYKEKFPLSTTLLVWMTDGWHLTKSLMWVFTCLSVAFLVEYIHGGDFWLAFFVSRGSIAIGFNISWPLITTVRPRT